MDLQKDFWDKKIRKLTKKSDVRGLDKLLDIISQTQGVDDGIKLEYIRKCEDAKTKVKYVPQQQEVSSTDEDIVDDTTMVEYVVDMDSLEDDAMEQSSWDEELVEEKSLDEDTIEEEIVDEDSLDISEDTINAEDVTVGESARHFKISKKKIRSLAIGGIMAVVALSHSNLSSAVELIPQETEENVNDEEIEIENEDTNELEIKTIKPTLAFDTENTEVMIENMKEFVKGALPNGIELIDSELEEQVESLINYYVWLNLNEIGPTYLSELYQTDSISYIEVFSDSMYWANVLRFDSITSSIQDNTVVDLSKLISNKKDLALVQNFQQLNARLHDAVNANDVANIQGIVSEYQELIQTKLLDHVSYTYGQGAMDLCFRLVYSGEQLLADYDMVIMDDSLAKIINEDEFLKCIQSVSISTIEDRIYTKEELEQTIQLNTSKKSDNVIYQIDILKDYMSRLNMQLDFTGKKSVADVMIEVSADIRDNNLLSTYKENESLDVFFARIYDQTHVELETIKPSDVIVDNGNSYVEKEELDKYGVVTDNKTPEQIETEYQEQVKEEVESSLENEKTFTDTNGTVLESGSDAEDYAADYSKGYADGSKQGAIDGNALASLNSVVTGNKGYVDGYALGYKVAYAEAKQNRLNAEKETSVAIETIKPVEQSSQVVESGTYKQPEITTKQQETTTIKQPETTTKQQETTTIKQPETIVTPIVKEEETTTIVIEEEVIEEGIVTLSKEELYNIYMQTLDSYNSSLEEETVKVKTR